MWIDSVAKEDHLRTWVKHCPAMKLVSTLDGQILWANAAFCEWSQYTLNELRKLTWMQISVPDKNLESDIDEAKNLDAYNPVYQVKKQYVPKGNKPEWGNLTVMRYPLTGPIECCLCTWEPLKNGTAAAFTQAMEQYQEIGKRLEAMAAEIKVVTNQSDEDRFVLSTIRMIQRHPRMAASFLVVALSIFGLNNIVELLQRTGLIQIPVKIERMDSHAEAHAAMVREISDPARVVAVEAEFSHSAPNGTISITKFSDGRFAPVSVATRRVGTEGNRGQSGSEQLADGGAGGVRTDNATHELRDSKSVTF